MCFTYFRERKMPTCDVEEIENTVIDCDRLIEAEDYIYLRNILGELSQEVREVIILRIYEEMKFKDIAKIMECGVSTAKSRYRLGVGQQKNNGE